MEVQVVNNRKLVPGMYVVVNFINVKGEPPLIIPGAAIVVRNGQTAVAVVENQTVHIRPIGIGRDYGDQTEIVNGLKEGDVIVTNVTDEVREGVEVDPQLQNNQAEVGGQSDKNPGNQGQYRQQRLTNGAQKAGGSGKGNSGGAQGGSGSGSAGSGKQ